MAIKIPVRAQYTDTDVTGLSEFLSEEVIPVIHGGTGISTVSPNAVIIGNDINSLAQIVVPDGYILIGAADDAIEATNIINCVRG